MLQTIFVGVIMKMIIMITIIIIIITITTIIIVIIIIIIIIIMMMITLIDHSPNGAFKGQYKQIVHKHGE